MDYQRNSTCTGTYLNTIMVGTHSKQSSYRVTHKIGLVLWLVNEKDEEPVWKNVWNGYLGKGSEGVV